MPARKNRLELDQSWRSKISTSMIINRLNANALGQLEKPMTKEQIRSAEIVLKKVVPDLKAIEHSGPDGGALEVKIVEFNLPAVQSE